MSHNSRPHLRVLPNPTADAMARLGSTTIAEVLGTYEHNLAMEERLFHEMVAEGLASDESPSAAYRALYNAWKAFERRVWLYRVLGHEVGP